MSSFEERYYRRDPTPLEALRRDFALLRDLLRAAGQWLLAGGRLRRRLRRARTSGEPIVLEEMP